VTRADIYAAVGAERFDLVAHLERQSAWSERTFGPGDCRDGVLDHTKKEIVEVRESGGDLSDLVILALDGAWRSGASPHQVVEAIMAKQAKNEARAWPDWRTADPGKAIEHVRGGSET
jgi:hypothetical protein